MRRDTRTKESAMQNHNRAAAIAIVSIVCVLSLMGFSRPPSKTAPPPQPFEIAVREVNVEIGFDGDARGAAPVESRTVLRHFGRIESPRGGRDSGGSNTAVMVFTDSLLFRSESPFRFVAALSRDTIQISSAENKSAAQMGGIESDEEMLRCLFEGPSIAIRFPGENPEARAMEHFKSDCPGGLYRRLNLPVTIGAFVFAIPKGLDRSESHWQAIVESPSFSGLGFFPQIRWQYTVKKTASGTEGQSIEIVCDTTLTGVRATIANGETVDIIADRIQVRGTLEPWPGLLCFYQGEIEIQEEIRYVRPALDSSVLEKRCAAVITFAPR
jgi:hypothetical protein